MASSLNRIMLLGRLGKDQETRFTANNLAVTSFSIATDHSYKDKDGQWVSETTWHNCISFSLSDYYKDGLKKGKRVYVEGRLTKKDYTDKDGIKRYSTDVVTEKIILLDNKNAQDSGSDNDSIRTPAETTGFNSPGPSFDDDNSDLPF
ncbi:MAG TPA: single-stranded DNA-binding protein [Ignavibacteriales bacterium]|nr:single-stranded DNA-binding protein [Ignavibacteriales bacterium]